MAAVMVLEPFRIGGSFYRCVPPNSDRMRYGQFARNAFFLWGLFGWRGRWERTLMASYSHTLSPRMCGYTPPAIGEPFPHHDISLASFLPEQIVQDKSRGRTVEFKLMGSLVDLVFLPPKGFHCVRCSECNPSLAA